jgi:hypothetical protein
LPPLAVQRRIVELSALSKAEGRLMRDLATRREHLFSLILGDAANLADQQEPAR